MGPVDALASRRRRQLLATTQITLMILSAVSVILGWTVVALIILFLGIVTTLGYFRVPDVEDPDPELPSDLVSELQRQRDSGNEVRAVRELRTRHPNLGLAQAVRIVRSL
jgi:hypothetical protein